MLWIVKTLRVAPKICVFYFKAVASTKS